MRADRGGLQRPPGGAAEFWRHPCWDGFRALARRLDTASWPSTAQLNDLLPPGAVSGSGAPLRFVPTPSLPAASLPAVEYESRIFETGAVSTREHDWHDLFNALVWCRLPKLKAALNAVHYRNLDRHGAGRRGVRRDALTLLDESGALILSRSAGLVQALSRRDWERAFVGMSQAWRADTRIVICGHAVLEKLLDPWKSITAHALLLHADAAMPLRGGGLVTRLDAALGDRLRDRGLCDSPADLSPVPLMGVPGWWTDGLQDGEFYADRSVFRAPSEGFEPAPVHRFDPS